jgi:colanic acid/amylovoran biosynthesis glycosyltransferase
MDWLMKIAYFINQYPKVSHSFIRREILSLEAKGISISRYSLRGCKDELIDELDLSEFNKTKYILNVNPFKIIYIALTTIIINPKGILSGFILAMRLGINSDRGLLRHIVYLAEACVLTQWMKSANNEHVHAHFGTNSAAIVMLAHKLGGPNYSFTVHGSELNNAELISLDEKIRQASFVAAVSSYGRSQLYRLVEYEFWNKIKVVHCGLEPMFYQIDIPPISKSCKLVCVGRLSKEKGQLLLLEAIKSLINDGINMHLILAGDGPMRGEIERLIDCYQLGSSVHITGWISSIQVREELLTSRGLILPSFSEGLPVVIMEAMSLKRPVVATYLAGIPELVIPNENGWLVPAGSIDDLKEAIKQILKTSEADLDKLGENGRTRVLERHDINIESDKLLKYFRAAIAKNIT